ncbi:hypothetical protein CDAR_372011 [Caerostris darwini]|uniref:Uncharacterized protein n=1 Tax=Caerostris darwini TaxID=1538125 RepID=A0AAV4VZD7_9ARAC|nr:hypothetical protein CDAR_372011 [Caerostris darwini]
MTVDVKMMYKMILIDSSQHCLQRIMGKDNGNDPSKTGEVLTEARLRQSKISVSVCFPPICYLCHREKALSLHVQSSVKSVDPAEPARLGHPRWSFLEGLFKWRGTRKSRIIPLLDSHLHKPKTMWNKRFQQICSTLCITFLLVNPSESLPSLQSLIGGHKGASLSDLLTVSIIGLALGGVKNKLRQHQAPPPPPPQQPQASANHQRPMFMPWQAAPAPQYPMMQPTQMMPTLHPQMIQQQPFIQDISPLLMQLGQEQMFSSMATQLAPSVLGHQAMDDTTSLMHNLDSFKNLPSFADPMQNAALQQQWKALESKAIRTLLRYGAQ